MSITTLSGTITDNTATDSLTVKGVVGQANASGFFLHLSGVFGGASVTVQFRGQDGVYRALANGVFTAAQDKQIIIPNDVKVRLLPTSTTGTTNIYWQLSSMAQS